MFGPDICGPATKKVHAIFNYKGKNLLINKDIRCKDDVHTHVYRLVVKPDNTYKVSIDGETVEKGELEKDWNFLAPKKIKDPNAKKPEDWDDRAKIDDPEDKKPEDWEQPEYIPDPDATKPEDWDDEMDGEWEPPQINNPAFKGKKEKRKVIQLEECWKRVRVKVRVRERRKRKRKRMTESESKQVTCREMERMNVSTLSLCSLFMRYIEK